MLNDFFYDLEKKMEQLEKSSIDNEALRHDLIIRPFLTHPLTLNWDGMELISQHSENIPKEIQNSYFWRNAVPKKKIADILIVPYGLNKPVVVVEEKRRQIHISNLKNHIGQLKEYQYLHNTVWGLLTDGNKWILQKNNEIFHQFDSINEVKNHLIDIQNCIGRKQIIERIKKYNTSDLVIIKPSPHVIIIATPTKKSNACTLEEYFNDLSFEKIDLIVNFAREIGEKFNNLTKGYDGRFRYFILQTINHYCRTPLNGYCGFGELLLLDKVSPKDFKRFMEIRNESLNNWAIFYTLLVDFYENNKQRVVSKTDFIDFCKLANIYDEDVNYFDLNYE